MRESINEGPARGWHHGGALREVRMGISNDEEDTTALYRFQATTLARTLTLLPDTAAALALLVYGGH